MAESMLVEMVPVGPIQTNAFVIGCPTTGQGAIVDPGDEGARLVKLAQSKDIEIKQILITHGHVDHVAAVGDVKQATGAEVLIHEADRELYDRCEMLGLPFGIRASAPPEPDRTIVHDDVLKVGDLEARVIETPGHSLGGVSFYFESEAVVFVGDTLFQGSIGRTDLPGGSFEQLMKNIHGRLLTLPGDTQVCCGHGPPTTVSTERSTNPFVLGLVP